MLKKIIQRNNLMRMTDKTETLYSLTRQVASKPIVNRVRMLKQASPDRKKPKRGDIYKLHYDDPILLMFLNILRASRKNMWQEIRDQDGAFGFWC